MMEIRCALAIAAVVLAVSTSSARACDDVHEEMTLAAAREAVKAARVAAQQQPAERADALAPGQAEATSVASAELRSAHPQVAAEPTSPLAR
jgi:hypothetical protein